MDEQEKHFRKRNQEILRKGFDDFRKFVNPLIFQRAQLSGEIVQYVKVQNGMLIDVDGKVYEDFHGTQALGHRNPVIAKALRVYLEDDDPSWYPSRVNPFTGAFARKLCERSGYSQVFFGCTGSESVEAAMKLSRAATKRPRIIGLENAYHGCTFGSTALMAKGPFRDPFEPHLPGVSSIPFADIDALLRELEQNDVAAVIVEPIQGEGGVRPLPQSFIDALCELCPKHGTLLVADEVQTALGRSGHFVNSAQWPRQADIICMGKALGGGLMPVSATLTQMEIFQRAYGKHFESAESHNSTFSNNALSCVAGLAMLDFLTDDLIAKVKEKGKKFREILHQHLSGSPLFKEVRGDGLMIGIQFNDVDNPWLSFENFGFDEFTERPSIGPLMCMRLYRCGYITYVCGHDWSIMRLQPRLNISMEKLVAFAKACRQEMDYLTNLL